MALENKKYLDYAGLQRYDSLIKQVINKLDKDTDARLDTIEKMIGQMEDYKDLTTDQVSTIAKAILAEKTRAEAAEKTLTDNLAAEITRATNAETALTNKIGNWTPESDSTVKSRIESIEEAIGLDGVTGGDSLNKRVESLEGLLTGDFGTNATVKEYVDNTLQTKVESLDATNNKSDAVAGITVQVDEADGIVSKPVITVANNAVTYVPAAGKEKAKVNVANTSAVLKGDAVAGIINYIDAKDDANSSKAASDLQEVKDDLYGVGNNGTGKLGEIDNSLTALKALHADKTNTEGAVIGKKTVKEQIDESIAAVVAGAPDTFDTLKEIADWIADPSVDGVTAESIITSVNTLKSDANTDGSVANSIKNAVDALNATVANWTEGGSSEKPNVVATISEVGGKLTSVVINDDVLEGRLVALESDTTDTTAIKELNDKLYGTGEGEAHVDGDIDKINKAIAEESQRAKNAETDISNFVGTLPEDAEATTVVDYAEQIVAAEEAARKAQIGELGNVSAEEGAANHTVKSYVDALAAKTAGRVELNGDLNATRTVSGAEGTTTTETVSYGSIKITEVDGKLTGVEASLALQPITNPEIDELFKGFDFIQYVNVTDVSM